MPITDAFLAVRDTTVPDLSQANRFTRFVLSADLRSPATDQISIETQRELTKDLVMKIGYIRTRGTGLLQNVDGNPCLPLPTCTRVNPNLGIINLYTNAASSTYNALQASLTKRLSRSFSAGLHYTWSRLIDDVTDAIPASTSEFARSQNSFDRRADRGRSGYDRPHRLTGNFVYELPFYQHQTGSTGKFLAGGSLIHSSLFKAEHPLLLRLVRILRVRESDSSESEYKFGSIEHDDQRNFGRRWREPFQRAFPGAAGRKCRPKYSAVGRP